MLKPCLDDAYALLKHFWACVAGAGPPPRLCPRKTQKSIIHQLDPVITLAGGSFRLQVGFGTSGSDGKRIDKPGVLNARFDPQPVAISRHGVEIDCVREAIEGGWVVADPADAQRHHLRGHPLDIA